jgi:hypothetical protein
MGDIADTTVATTGTWSSAAWVGDASAPTHNTSDTRMIRLDAFLELAVSMMFALSLVDGEIRWRRAWDCRFMMCLLVLHSCGLCG